jgi:hypothetical protein
MNSTETQLGEVISVIRSATHTFAKINLRSLSCLLAWGWRVMHTWERQ